MTILDQGELNFYLLIQVGFFFTDYFLFPCFPLEK